MKTSKAIISIALVTLATTSFGLQNRWSNRSQVTAYLVSEKTYEEDTGLEAWMTTPFVVSLPAAEMTTNPEAPLAEEEITLESWMAIPFQAAFYEAELVMEEWMSVPFEHETMDGEMVLETWMTLPFTYPGLEEGEVEMEEWMVAALWE